MPRKKKNPPPHYRYALAALRKGTIRQHVAGLTAGEIFALLAQIKGQQIKEARS